MRRHAMKAVLMLALFAAAGAGLAGRWDASPTIVAGSEDTREPGTPGPVGDAPLQLENGRLVVTVTVEGAAPLRFILDTAAGSSAIAARHLEPLGIGPDRLERVRVVGVGAARVMTRARLASIGVGGARIDGIDAVVLDDGLLGGRRGYDGLLGNDVLRRFDAEIDVPGSRLRLYEHGQASALLRDPPLSPVRMAPGPEGFIAVEAALNGQPLMAILDTGTPATIVNWRAAALAGIGRSSPDLRRLQSGARGLDGIETETYSHPLQGLAIGSSTVAPGEVRIADLPLFAVAGLDGAPAALLGADVLRRCPVLLAYGERRLHVCAAPR